MITFDKDTCIAVHNCYLNSLYNGIITIEDIMYLSSIVNTYKADTVPFKYSSAYWDFLDSLLDYFKTGIWTTLPRFWFTYCCGVTTKLTENEALTRYNGYLKKRATTLKNNGIDPGYSNDRNVLLKLIKAEDGEFQFLEICTFLLRLYLFYAKQNLAGIPNDVAFGTKQFNFGEQGGYAGASSSGDENEHISTTVKVGTKFELTRNFFKTNIGSEE